MSRRIFMILAFLLLGAKNCWANPGHQVVYLVVGISLVAESLLIGAVFYYRSFHFCRTCLCWFVATGGTWILFALVMSQVEGSVASRIIVISSFWGSELLIVIIEGFILFKLSQLAWLQMKQTEPLTISRAFLIALLANIFSLALPAILARLMIA